MLVRPVSPATSLDSLDMASFNGFTNKAQLFTTQDMLCCVIYLVSTTKLILKSPWQEPEHFYNSKAVNLMEKGRDLPHKWAHVKGKPLALHENNTDFRTYFLE